MTESTITLKGQTTVPADIRAFIDAKPGTRLVWSAMPDGTVIVRAKTKSILEMAGSDLWGLLSLPNLSRTVTR